MTRDFDALFRLFRVFFYHFYGGFHGFHDIFIVSSFSLFLDVCVCGLAASFMLMPFAVLFFFDFGSILKR